MSNSRKRKKSGKNFTKKESSKKYKKKRNQARIQEYKNLAWRYISCLIRQDSVYMILARKLRSVFSGKNLG